MTWPRCAARSHSSLPVGRSSPARLDYRLRTSDPAAARRVAAETPQLRVLPDDNMLRRDDEALVVCGAVPALDDLVARLVGAGVAVRELAPVVAPLEAAFLALTAAANVPSEEEDL
jgi:ABC-2 type transport system ATP-binding protein